MYTYNRIHKLKHLAWELRFKSDLRFGQSLMVALRDMDYECYVHITNTNVDCFYDNERIISFWEAIKDYYKKKGKE